MVEHGFLYSRQEYQRYKVNQNSVPKPWLNKPFRKVRNGSSIRIEQNKTISDNRELEKQGQTFTIETRKDKIRSKTKSNQSTINSHEGMAQDLVVIGRTKKRRNQ